MPVCCAWTHTVRHFWELSRGRDTSLLSCPHATPQWRCMSFLVAGRRVMSVKPCAVPTQVTCKATLTDLQKEILFNDDVIAINQDITPQGRPIVTGNASLWARFLSDDSVAVAFYNENDVAINVHLDFSSLAKMDPLPVPSAATWSATTKATVRDLWAHTDGAAVTGGYPAGDATLAVQPHEAKLFRFTKTA
eukprot:m.678506 g.678506  ORF g.678506 m.678506 type:complete len:192 (-) comp22804_c2_seq17:458-1033(-)